MKIPPISTRLFNQGNFSVMFIDTGFTSSCSQCAAIYLHTAMNMTFIYMPMNVYQHHTPVITTDNNNTSTYSNEYDPCTDHWPRLHYWQYYLAPPVSSTAGLFTFLRHETEICPSPPALPWRDNTVAPRWRHLLQASHVLGLQQNLLGGMTDWLWTSRSLNWRGVSDWNEETRRWGFVDLHTFYFCSFDIMFSMRE